MKTQNVLRQKLINMMYLILIALLILNMPVDFIESFTELTRTIERSNYLIDGRTDKTVRDLNRFAASNPDYEDKLDRISKVRFVSDSTIAYIENLKDYLISESGGYGKYGHLNRAIDATLSTRVLVREESGNDLHNLLIYTKQQLLDIMNDPRSVLLDSVLVTSDTIYKAKGIPYTWEKYYFDNVPLGGVIATLTKFQNDVRMAQYITVNHFTDSLETYYSYPYYASVDEEGRKRGPRTIIVDPSARRSDVFQVGEEGITKVIIPDIPSNQMKEAVVYLYDSEGNIIDSMRFYGKIGEIQLKTDKAGEYTLKGTVKLREGVETAAIATDAGAETVEEQEPLTEEQRKQQQITAEQRQQQQMEAVTSQKDNKQLKTEIPFEYKYNVVIPEPYISQEKFNTLYIGIPNPLRIYHPEIDRRDHEVEISQGKILTKEDKFYARVHREGYVTANLKIKNDKGEMVTVAKERFKVKDLPSPEVTLYNKSGGEMSAKIFTMQKGLEADLSKLEIDAPFRIVEFDVIYINSSGAGIVKEQSRGAYFTGRVRELIDMAQPGDIYIFNNIKVKGPGGRNMQVDGLVFEII